MLLFMAYGFNARLILRRREMRCFDVLRPHADYIAYFCVSQAPDFAEFACSHLLGLHRLAVPKQMQPLNLGCIGLACAVALPPVQSDSRSRTETARKHSHIGDLFSRRLSPQLKDRS